MLCETCRFGERPGFVRASRRTNSAEAVAFVPCPDCGGQAIAHCCDGICEQPAAADGAFGDHARDPERPACPTTPPNLSSSA
jgi:hypothetical protein